MFCGTTLDGALSEILDEDQKFTDIPDTHWITYLIDYLDNKCANEEFNYFTTAALERGADNAWVDWLRRVW